jgi:hypothetical protein
MRKLRLAFSLKARRWRGIDSLAGLVKYALDQGWPAVK